METRTQTNIHPRILVVGRSAWDDRNSTLSNIFGQIRPDHLAYVCIESRQPDLKACSHHFQISEVSMIKKLFFWRTETGKQVSETSDGIDRKSEAQEKKILNYVRGHRSLLYLFLREILWALNGWKSKGLKAFIQNFNPDVIFCIGDPLPLIGKLQLFVIRNSGVNGALYMLDDIYSYQLCHGLLDRFYRSLLRRQVRKLVGECRAHLAISPKMKREYDVLFGINCTLLTKHIQPHAFNYTRKKNQEIRFVYTGNLIYGRYESLLAISNAILKISHDSGKTIALDIYTQTPLGEEEQRQLVNQCCHLHEPVPYEELGRIYNDADVLLFVESLDENCKYIARLSFSTKLSDYIGCGRCIFAIGDKDTAPIEYLKENDIAITCISNDEIYDQLKCLLDDPDQIGLYAEKSYTHGQTYLNEQLLNDRLMSTVSKIL